ncbi:hypothetical protein JVU11DRAFT_5366 [Chiua virens]|nr:hypothetical protein JVU11DRAFT_5366 [Chiua virens]
MPENHHDDQDDSRPKPAPYFQVPPLPPETYNYLIHALLSLQGSAHPQNHPPPYPNQHHLNSLPNYNYSWPPVIAPLIPTAPIAGLPSFYPQVSPLGAPGTSKASELTPSPATSSTAVATPQEPEETEDAISITEDKRRRNTVASARFRVKKKLKSLNLERTVTDLTGRTDELEREAGELRRENAWLKEIVLLKGRNLAALNVPGTGDRHDGDGKDDRNADGEPGSRGKGKEKESN